MHKSLKHMVSKRCHTHAYTMISFIWRFRTCKTILHERNQINGCLGQRFVGVGDLLQSGTKCILGWWILSILIAVLVTWVYCQTWRMCFIKCKFQQSWLKNKLEKKQHKNFIKEISLYTAVLKLITVCYFQNYIEPDTRLKKHSLTAYFVTIHPLWEAP